MQTRADVCNVESWAKSDLLFLILAGRIPKHCPALGEVNGEAKPVCAAEHWAVEDSAKQNEPEQAASSQEWWAE